MNVLHRIARVADSRDLPEQTCPEGPNRTPATLHPSSLRILHCIPSLGGGGAERQLAYLCLELAKAGAEVHVVCRFPGHNERTFDHSGVTLHRLRPGGNYSPSLVLELARIIRRIKPDLVQTWLPQMDVAAGFAAMVTGTPFILSERTSAPAYSVSWKSALRNWMGRRANRVVANSELGKEYWSIRIEPTLITVIPNGVPLDEIQSVEAASFEQDGINSTAEIILFAGRFSLEKNPIVLLSALREVLSERPRAVGLLFGEGPLEGEMIKLVKSQEMEERLKILAYTPDLWSWMKRANVFVSASLFEGSPNVVLEAAALNCPLVLSDIPAHRELVGEESAFFVAPSSPSDIARGIVGALQDPDLARQKATAAYEVASQRSMRSVISAYLELYREAVAG